MRRMTCHDGFVFVATICLGAMVTSARSGNLDSPAAPESAAGAMFTVEDIYNKVNARTNVSKRTGAFTEPVGGPTNGSMHTLNAIMALVTNRAPVAKTGQKKSYYPCDDGWYGTNLGVAWPNPRFAVQGDINATNDVRTNCVVDNLTGLMWTRNANLPGHTMQWSTSLAYGIGAVDYCSTNMNFGAGTFGYTDWRLPNVNELHSLIDASNGSPALPAGHPFVNVQANTYWVSTPFSGWQARYVSLLNGSINILASGGDQSAVWPVRGGR